MGRVILVGERNLETVYSTSVRRGELHFEMC